ncbi:TPM domain-containing protein [Aureimonas fodinaquatilis]|uniref:TPM domain-containing protein n=1 Tax=Aureimonas fodinaquatilis TaxID=2565783 RepID=A0A5B0DSD6_9HYPH|nr:TPM domain-containing protein [Aureimonas fodinaquatilis]KAA0969416.1 TPM domain-containing protein [Aureimonas fodinaquatilis]
MMPLRFSTQDHDRISLAIRDAEKQTAGEIYAVFARQSHDGTALAFAMALALCLAISLIASLIAALVGHPVNALTLALGQGLGAGLLCLALWRVPALRQLFVPNFVASAAAAKVAQAQFLAHNLHVTSGRTGVLLFVSEAEHYAEVIADSGIHQHVSEADWQQIVDVLTKAARQDQLVEGFVEAIRRSGALLSVHFPPTAHGRNELPDRLVEM